MKQLLDAIFQLVRPVAAHVLQPRPVMAQRRIGHRRFQELVVDAVELERKEQQVRRRRRQPLLHVAVEFGAGRIERIAGVHEAGIGAEPAGQIVDRFILAHRLGERAAGLRRLRQLKKLALEGALERNAFGIDALEVALDRRIVQAGIEVGQIPFRQRTQSALRLCSFSLFGLSLGRTALGPVFNGAIFRHRFCAHDF